MPTTMQMAEPEAGVPPRTQAALNWPRVGALDSVSHGMKTLEQELVPMPLVGAGTDPKTLWRV